MFLSETMEEFQGQMKVEYIHEQEVEVLMLCASKCSRPSCVFVDDEKYINDIPETASMVITNLELRDKLLNATFGLIVTEKPRLLFFKLHNYLAKNSKKYYRDKRENSISSTASISKTAIVADGNVVIGKNVIIEDNVIIHSNTSIGDNSIIRAGTIIGGVGFEFKRDQDTIFGVEHAGGVVIGQEVEIQYNTTIDRAIYPWDNTEIGDYCKIDNLVQIAHAVKMREAVMVAANSNLGGRVEVGKKTWMGLSVTIRNGITIGSEARINMGAVVTKSVSKGEEVSGNFAINHKDFIKQLKRNKETL